MYLSLFTMNPWIIMLMNWEGFVYFSIFKPDIPVAEDREKRQNTQVSKAQNELHL